jgi:hypothetical protein
VIVLLDAVDHALPGRVIHNALAADGVRNRAALSGVLAFRLDGNGVVAEHVELSLGERLLVKLTALGGGRYWIEHATICNSSFCVVGN